MYVCNSEAVMVLPICLIHLLCYTSVLRSTHLVLEFPVDIVGEVVGVL